MWSLYSLDKEGMREYLPDLVRAVRKALEGSEVAVQDRERLKQAERVGAGCGRKLAK